MLLENRVAIVTGASRGIGRAVALDLAAHGAHVVTASRESDEARETVDAITGAGGSAVFAPTDLREEDAVKRLASAAADLAGRIDIVVNNAATGRLGSVESETLEGFNDVLATNLAAPFVLIKYAAGALKASGSGSVINIGSVLGIVGMRDHTAYSAAKAGLHHMTKQIALELAPDNVRVNCVVPGFIRTAMYERHPPELKRHVERVHALGRVGEVQEVADAVTFLASDKSSFITGACLAVDGGLTSQFGLT